MAQSSTFDPQDAETIYEALSEGRSLLSICEAMGIAYSTARRWEDDFPEHAAKSARARELGCHFLAEQCLQIADTPLEGIETTEEATTITEVGTGGEINMQPATLTKTKRADMLGHRKLQIDTRMRLIGKWAPKLYGEKLELSGNQDAPLTVVVKRLTDA